MTKSENIGELAKALCAAQAEFPIVLRDKKNPFFNSKYADLQTVRAAITPVLLKYGLSYVQLPSGDGKTMRLQTVLLHASGQWISDEGFAVAIAEKKDKQGQPMSDPQGVAAAITYARRYGLTAVLGVVSDDDDDGEAASGRGGRQQQRPASTPAARGVARDDAPPPSGPAAPEPSEEQRATYLRLLGDCHNGWADWTAKRAWRETHKAAKDSLSMEMQLALSKAYGEARPTSK